MFLDIYKLINKLQDEIGNGAHVRITTWVDSLEIRVDWPGKDFHVQYQFNEKTLSKTDYTILFDFFVSLAKNAYDIKFQ